MTALWTSPGSASPPACTSTWTNRAENRSAQFKKVLDEAGRRKLAVQLGYMYRNNPCVQFCQRAVREGWLGQVFEVDCVMSVTHSLDYRKYLAQYPGGTMFIFACHLIDLVVSLLGKPDRIATFPRQTRSDVGAEIENPYPLEHELLVQECLLKACGKLSE